MANDPVKRARDRLLKRYERMKKKGGWRAVAETCGLNVGQVYNFAMKGKVPGSPETRHKLGLPRKLPSERKKRVKKPVVMIGQPGWEQVYLRKVKP